MDELLKDQPMYFGGFLLGGGVILFQSGTGFGHSCGHIQGGSDDGTQKRKVKRVSITEIRHVLITFRILVPATMRMAA